MTATGSRVRSGSRVGTFALLLLLVLAAVGGSACGPDEINSPQIQRWCGDRPCFWQVSGKIERVGSWNANDYAVSLVSDHAQLWQDSPYTDSGGDARCVRISLLTKIDPGVHVFLDVDFLARPGAVPSAAGQGWTRRLAVSDFDPVQYQLIPPTWYDHARFTVRKDGPGRAVLGKVQIVSGNFDCSGDTIELDHRPVGAYCELDAQCEMGGCEGALFRSGTCSCPAAPDAGHGDGDDGGEAARAADAPAVIGDAGAALSCGCLESPDAACPAP